MPIAILPLSVSSALEDTAAAIQAAGMEVFDFSWDLPLETLTQASAFVLLADTDYNLNRSLPPSLADLLKAQSDQGKPILGLGAASVFLVENGLVPGLYKHMVGLSLSSQTPVPGPSLLRLADDYQYNAFTRSLSLKDRWDLASRSPWQFKIPAGLMAEVKSQGLDVFWYCDAESRLQQLAALANKAGNVLALLPGLENDNLQTGIFSSLRDHLASGFVEQVEPLYYWPRR